MHACSSTAAATDGSYEFDVRGISRRVRHAAIFGALESLADGEALRFINDHDPLPLLDQIRSRYGDQVAINYLSRDVNQVVIDFRIKLGAQSAAQEPTGGCGGNGAAGCCSGGQH